MREAVIVSTARAQVDPAQAEGVVMGAVLQQGACGLFEIV